MVQIQMKSLPMPNWPSKKNKRAISIYRKKASPILTAACHTWHAAVLFARQPLGAKNFPELSAPRKLSTQALNQKLCCHPNLGHRANSAKLTQKSG